MDRRITARLNMANAFKQVCDDNQAIVRKVPAFESLVAMLGIKITAIRSVIKSVSTNNGGLVVDKTNWKERLSLLLSVVCGAGVAYARKVREVVLEEKFSYAETVLSNMRDTELIERAHSIIEQQESVAAQLVEYGITSELMEEVKAALINFEAKNALPIVNVYAGEAKREEALKLAFELSDFVLQNMMKAALIYKITDPGFFQTLENASRISKVGIRHEEMSTEPTAALEQKSAQEQTVSLDVLENAVQDIKPEDIAEEMPVKLAAPSLNGV